MATKDCAISKFKILRHMPYPKQKPDGTTLNTQIDESQISSKQQCSASDTSETSTTETYPCVAARQPYAGFILNGIKTIETRWNPMFKEIEGKTVAIHVAWKDWERGNWIEFLKKIHEDDEIQVLLEDGEKHGRGIIAGLVDIGETWQCPEDADSEKVAEWEKSALLTPLNEKYLTKLVNPRWLKKPVKVRPKRGIWYVKIPTDCV